MIHRNHGETVSALHYIYFIRFFLFCYFGNLFIHICNLIGIDIVLEHIHPLHKFHIEDACLIRGFWICKCLLQRTDHIGADSCLRQRNLCLLRRFFIRCSPCVPSGKRRCQNSAHMGALIRNDRPVFIRRIRRSLHFFQKRLHLVHRRKVGAVFIDRHCIDALLFLCIFLT